jgi:hypothetical protein
MIAIAMVFFARDPTSAQGSALFRTGADSMGGEPPVEVGVTLGRNSAAFGPGVIVQGNLAFFGLYGFAGRSSVSGYEIGDGIRAHFTDRTLGFGIECRVFRAGRFMFGAFAQAAYYGSFVKASYQDGYGGSGEYEESNRDPLVTVGPEIDYRATRGVSVFLRPGKDFGKNFAATTAGGFSINGGVRVGGMTILKSVKKLFP